MKLSLNPQKRSQRSRHSKSPRSYRLSVPPSLQVQRNDLLRLSNQELGKHSRAASRGGLGRDISGRRSQRISQTPLWLARSFSSSNKPSPVHSEPETPGWQADPGSKPQSVSLRLCDAHRQTNNNGPNRNKSRACAPQRIRLPLV